MTDFPEIYSYSTNFSWEQWEFWERGHPPQQQSFCTKTQAKKWIQDTETAIRDGRYKGLSTARKQLVN